MLQHAKEKKKKKKKHERWCSRPPLYRLGYNGPQLLPENATARDATSLAID